MKKLFMIVLLIPALSFSQQDSTKLTAKYIYEDVKSGFTKLVNSLQGPAKHTYEVYVKQQAVEAYSYLIIPIFLFILCVLFLTIGLKRANFKEADWNRYATFSVFGMVLSLAFVITGICFFACSFYAQLMNPEYYAIQEIIKQLK